MLAEATAIGADGLVTLERPGRQSADSAVERVRGARTRPPSSPSISAARNGSAGPPAFVAVCDLLHRHGIAGATALLGVDGTAHGQRDRARFFGRNAASR